MTDVAEFTVRKISDYLEPVQVISVPGTSRIFVAQRNGDIYVTNPAAGSSGGELYLAAPTTPLDNNGTLSALEGLSSIAAAPDFAARGIPYVGISNSAGMGKSGDTGNCVAAKAIRRAPTSSCGFRAGRPAARQ